MKLLLVGFFAAFALLSLSAPAQAAGTVFTVNAFDDLPDQNPGDKNCQTKKKTCTLRAAVMESNASCGGDYGCEETIVLPKGTYKLKRVGTDDNAFQGDLDVTGSVTIQGAGAADTMIDANGSVTGDRAFHLIAGTVANFVRLEGVTISGGIHERGGGIYNLGTNLYLIDSQVIYNVSTHGGGGGIYSDKGDVELRGSTVGVNKSIGSFGFGAGIYMDGGYLFGEQSRVMKNEADGNFSNGGGIYLTGNATANLSQVAVQENTSTEYGGGIRITSGTLGLHKSSVLDNYAEVSGGGVMVDSGASLRLENSTVRGNMADINVGDAGGGLYLEGDAEIVDSKIESNSALKGGGIYKVGGATTIVGTRIDDNYGSSEGGGIYHFWGPLGIAASSITRNLTNSEGGGVYVYTGELSLTNTTVSGNHANTKGGGVYVDGTAGFPKAELFTYNATIASNGAGIENKGGGLGGGVFNEKGFVTVQNTLLADNFQYDSPTQEASDCQGEIKSKGYNLIEVPGAFCAIGGDTTGNIIGQDPQLSALGGNQTEWHKIPLGSKAVDAGNPNGCTDQNGALLDKDQRGVDRHLEGDNDGNKQCDIGAYENGDLISPNP